jgi:hypothetical protein
VRWQTLVRRIARRDARGSRKANRRRGAGSGALRRSADAHGGCLEAKTVRESCDASKPGRTQGSTAGGNSGRTRHGGRRPDRRSCSTARWGRVTVSVARVNARRFVARQSVEPAGRRSWNRRDGARAATKGRQRLAMCGVKAAPADEARVVDHHEAPRGAGPRKKLNTRTSRSMRKRHRERMSPGQVNRSWPVRIARPSCPARTARTEQGRESQRGRSRRIEDARHASSAHTPTTRHAAEGSRVRS